jgi:hypothetical protein
MPTEAEVKALADAMWQLLDDMDGDSQSVCLAAKAKARIAFEPFNDEPEASPDMTMEQAREIVSRCERN